jgi:hypothetical protein
MALTPHQQQYGTDWPAGVAVWAISGLFLLIASLLTMVYGSTYSVISTYTDWSAVVTNLVTIGLWLSVAVFSFGWEQLRAKRKCGCN